VGVAGAMSRRTWNPAFIAIKSPHPLSSFGDVFVALDRLPIPVFTVASNGVIRWLNPAGESLVGDKRGVAFPQVFAPESRAAARTAFASKVVGSRMATMYDAVMLKADGSKVNVEISSAVVEGAAGVVGVFGAVNVEAEVQTNRRPATRELTPRQAAVLGYLAQGYSTGDMAAAMGLSRETVRNHVRGLLQRLGVHSRLEAVATAHVRGLI
jgi:DNA-binding CsgD family transcriptional regulator